MLKITEEKNIALVSLNRPALRNAFDPTLIQKLTETFQHLAQRTDLRAIVLSGEGKVFCAGADLNWMKNMVNFSLQQNEQDSQKLFEMFESIWNCPMPVIGLVHGAAFGGALGLMAACDYVIAEEKTQMCFSEVRIGIAPAVIAGFIFRKASPGQLSHLMISGKIFNPKEALGSGLVQEIVVEAHLAEALGKAIRLFQDAAPEAVRETKKLLRKLPNLNWQETKKATCSLIAERRVSAEGQEGLKSFLEKRDPNWKVNP
jgi:methylglutaconyl-CoA hydratase